MEEAQGSVASRGRSMFRPQRCPLLQGRTRTLLTQLLWQIPSVSMSTHLRSRTTILHLRTARRSRPQCCRSDSVMSNSNVKGGNRTALRRWRLLPRGYQDGQSAVELALLAPVLVIILLVLIDLGRLFYLSIEVNGG